ncbi:MAG TPA: type ISP restriction/modification enzyme [Roseiflexaceae bacterium]|nr:type ISP restriction/modification enzyme [Roseiflexaceae bacterium]
MPPAHNPVETYLQALWAIRGSGAAVPETSAYGPFQVLLDSIGAHLSPKVRCIIGLRRGSAGLPDAGLFTADQFPRAGESEPRAGQLPARGVIEIKSTADDVLQIGRTPQVLGYLAHYGLVLVTNYRDFVLVERAPDGTLRPLERYALAASEAEFWRATPRELAERHGEALAEYLTRVLLHAAPLRSPKDVAFLLASYARDARGRVEAQRTLPALAAVRSGLEQGLGIAFEGERGEHFFRSTLVQTLFYGVFSAWVLWHAEDSGRTDRFTWRLAGSYLHLPVLQSLFGQLAQQNRLKALGLLEVLDWTDAAIARIERSAFFAAFVDAQAVQYFYEPFLEAFDPELRRQLGVWYTPPEIVQYQVARVDAALRSELGIADGLADPRVYVLDPCCGTGAYLVEVVNTIAATLRARGDDDLLGTDLARAVQDRVFGFELLPAPFVVAHLQIGLLLQRYGATLGGEERAAIYLTNALTGWEPPAAGQQRLLFPELEAERDAAARIKREAPILVVLGNPPYSGYAGIAIGEERDLSNAYRTTKAAPVPQGQGLNDLYVRFFRMAERRIVEGTRQGIVCFISNYSWLDGLSFTGMRERYLELFDTIWIDNLHGDRKISERTPEGLRSGPIFEVRGTAEGIQVGTAISMLLKRPGPASEGATVQYRDFHEGRAVDRRAALLASLSEPTLNERYAPLHPVLGLGLPFKLREVGAQYLTWPLLPELFPTSFPGVKTSRDDVVVDIDRDRLEARLRRYFDSAISHEEMRRIAPGAMEDSARFNAVVTRDTLRRRGFLPQNIVRYYYRPFDMRWLYWEPETKLLDEKRTDYWPHVTRDNIWLSAGQRSRKDDFYQPQVTTMLADHHIVESNVGMFPLMLISTEAQQRDLFSDPTPSGPQPNLTDRARSYLAELGAEAADLFFHTIAVLHAPAYAQENAGALRQDWPRIPLPATLEQLRTSAALGRQVAALIDIETPVDGVTAGTIRPALRELARLRRLDRSAVQPAAGDLALTAGWGYAGRGGITMSGRGRSSERPWTDEEHAVLGDAAAQLLGGQTLDVWLNERACWRNVPAAVWDYTIGGYQVVKKWLSYRERDLLGRDLTPDEARLVTQIVRRIAALLLLGPELDANYRAVSADG